MTERPTNPRQVSGLWQIRVPIPGSPLGATLVYAVEGEDGLVLVDAGWPAEESWQALLDGLEAIGSHITQVRGVVVTHFHPDHHGLAGRVRTASGAWVAMHPADAAVISTIRNEPPGAYGRAWAAHLLRAGATEQDLADLSEARGVQFDPPAVPNRLLVDGDAVPLGGRLMRVHHTPGHTPGHICLHLEPDGPLFSGDHLLPRISPHIGTWRAATDDPLGEYLGSLRALRGLDAERVLPAHITDFVDHAGRVDELLAHHDDRLGEITRLLAGGAELTMWEIAAGMTWTRDWESLSAFAKTLALSEADAHVKHLLATDVLARIIDSPMRFQLSAWADFDRSVG